MLHSLVDHVNTHICNSFLDAQQYSIDFNRSYIHENSARIYNGMEAVSTNDGDARPL